jgi:16S rRNA (guanine527-N7)-methyltransferase
METISTQSSEFASALEKHAHLYHVQLSASSQTRLREYYEQVLAWNTRLHLVAPCSPPEFATRHVLESLFALSYLPDAAHILDIGSGAGLPIIPCLIARTTLSATLIEASPKKAVFLREALRRVGAHNSAKVLAERFEKTVAPVADFVTCRALDRFTELLPTLLQWVQPESALLLFGGESLSEALDRAARSYESVLIPESERRFLFIVQSRS